MWRDENLSWINFHFIWYTCFFFFFFHCTLVSNFCFFIFIFFQPLISILYYVSASFSFFYHCSLVSNFYFFPNLPFLYEHFPLWRKNLWRVVFMQRFDMVSSFLFVIFMVLSLMYLFYLFVNVSFHFEISEKCECSFSWG